jgi:hypothetical protein
MYYEATYKVTSVTRSAEGETFDATKHGRRSMKGRTNISDIEVPDDVEVEPGDVVHLRIENHSGRSNRTWALDEFHGFHYDENRSCAVCR